jgi:hypothetical protein
MIYAKPGDSAQQFGGSCPDGWVQMQSERPEGNYVANESGEWVIPVKTTAEKLADAASVYQADLEKLKSQMGAANLADGTSQATKEAQIRAAYNTRRAEYAAEISSIKAGG